MKGFTRVILALWRRGVNAGPRIRPDIPAQAGAGSTTNSGMTRSVFAW